MTSPTVEMCAERARYPARECARTEVVTRETVRFAATSGGALCATRTRDPFLTMERHGRTGVAGFRLPASQNCGVSSRNATGPTYVESRRDSSGSTELCAERAR